MRKLVREVEVTYEDGTTEIFEPDDGKHMHLVVLNNNHITNGVVHDRFTDYSINWTKTREKAKDADSG